MDQKGYWDNKHAKYAKEEWITKPTIFATQAISFFPKTGYMLDLGAGWCQDSLYFAQHDYQVLATDISPAVLNQAKLRFPPELLPKVDFQVIDLSQPLSYAESTFDIVYCHLSMHFFDTQRTQALFNEIHTILKTDGIVAIMANTIDDPEVGQSQKVEEDLYITPSGLQKRFFSTASMTKFTSKFETLLLDNRGETHKDEIKTLIRYVGRKP